MEYSERMRNAGWKWTNNKWQRDEIVEVDSDDEIPEPPECIKEFLESQKRITYTVEMIIDSYH